MRAAAIAAAAMREAVERTGETRPSAAALNVALLALLVEERMTGFGRAAPNPALLPPRPRPPEGL